MIRSGLKPLIPDKRDLSFARTFGAVSIFPDSFNTDAGLTMPDQEADGFPFGCTGYTQSELCSDEDRIIYDPAYTYKHTLLIEGNEGQDVGCDLRNSLKSTITFGVQEKDKNDAYTHRRGAYYNCRTDNLDSFDSARSAMIKYSNLWGKKCSVSVASRWCVNFVLTGKDGIVPIPMMDSYSLHNWKVSGWKTINGVPYLIGKPWQGNKFGDNGVGYFSREIYNTLINDYFAGAYVLAPYTGDSMTVRLYTLEIIMQMICRAGFNGETIGKICLLIEKSLFGELTQNTTPTITPVQQANNTVSGASKATLDNFCLAIRDFEGQPGDLNYRNNNPGNCRYSSVGYLKMYGEVKKDKKGFAIFKDYATGWLYLQNMIREKIGKNPNQTMLQFMEKYAPYSDGNDPKKYSESIAKRLEVTTDFRMGDLIG